MRDRRARLRVIDGKQSSVCAVAVGSIAGVVVTLPVVAALALLHNVVDGFADSAWDRGLSLLVIAGYIAAGYIARSARAPAPRCVAALAGCGVALLHFAGSLVVWAFQGGAFLTGSRAAHATLVIVGPYVFGAIFGALGGSIAARRAATTER